MPPKPPPKAVPGKALTKNEMDAINAAKDIKDTEPEENKLAMRKELRALAKVLEEEERLLAFYQQEREKLNYNWIISKKELEDRKSELINKNREIEDLRENHIMTLNVYKQRIKHQLFQNQDALSELQKDVEVTLKQLEDEHRIKERELKTDIRSLQVNLREQELSNNDYRFALKVEHDKRTTLQRQEFERQAGELKKKYALKMDKQRAEMEEERMRMIKALEDRKDDMIKARTSEHAQKYTQIKTYYSDIITTNLDFIRLLRIDISDMQQKEENERKKLNAVERERRELQEPQKQLEIEIRRLEEDEKVQERIMAEKEAIKAEIDEIERHFREMEYEYEVKVQSLKYLQKETSQLTNLYGGTVHAVQQKAGLKNLLLEKKLANIQNDLEAKDLELNEFLLAANIDPRAVNSLPKTLEEVLDAKKDLIASLENQLQQIRRAHSHMIKAYEGKLSEFVIPIEELGFDPLVPTSVE